MDIQIRLFRISDRLINWPFLSFNFVQMFRAISSCNNIDLVGTPPYFYAFFLISNVFINMYEYLN